MTRLRALVCLLFGLVLGRVLGPLLVSDPTGLAATALTVVVAAASATALYRSTWL